jgi:hypothetical protein
MSIRTVARGGKLIEVTTLPDLPGVVTVKRKRRTPYLHMDMSRVVAGLSAAGRVWVYLLRQSTMRPNDPAIAVSSKHLKELGVDRYAKANAIASLERKGLIAVVKGGSGKNPRVKLLV